MSIQEAAKIIGVNETWVYRLIKAGRLRSVESGRRGRGKHTLLLRDDVERERFRRLAELEAKLRQARGEE